MRCLTHHLNQSEVAFVVHGFTLGFDIGFVGEVTNSRPKNLLSAGNMESKVLA